MAIHITVKDMKVVIKILFVLGLIIAGSPLIFAAITLLPGSASRVNRLGYYSICSWAPWSTIILIGIAVVLGGVVFLVYRKAR